MPYEVDDIKRKAVSEQHMTSDVVNVVENLHETEKNAVLCTVDLTG